MKSLAIIFALALGTACFSAAENLRIHRIDKIGASSETSPKFDHKEARAEATKIFAELAKKHSWEFMQSSDSEIFTDERLADVDVIIFDNNSGVLFDDAEKKAFEKWVRNGGGVVGIHGAAHAHKGVNEDNKAEWPFWCGLWGVLHKTGPREGPQGRREYADWVNMEASAKRWTSELPKRWQFEKVEWYFWNYHKNFHETQVIATAEVKKNQPELPKHYPVTWCHVYEGGRVWYANMGHYAENFRQKEFVQHLLDGIKWAAEAETKGSKGEGSTSKP